MISNLIHKPYTIETMNALEIKKTLIKQYHLTKLNIVGFYTSCNHHCNFLDSKEKYPVVYRDDFGKRKLCHFSLFMLDIENTGSETYYSTQESDFYSGTEVRVAA